MIALNFSFFYVADNKLIRRVDSAKGTVALYAPGVSVVVARVDGTDRTSLESESHGHAARMVLGSVRDAKMILGCWWKVLQRSA